MITEIYLMSYTMQKRYEDEISLRELACNLPDKYVQYTLPEGVKFLSISYREDIYVSKLLELTFTVGMKDNISLMTKKGMHFDEGVYTIRIESDKEISNDLDWVEDIFVCMQTDLHFIGSYFICLHGDIIKSFRHMKSLKMKEKSDLSEDAKYNYEAYVDFFSSYLRTGEITDDLYPYAAKILLDQVEE